MARAAAWGFVLFLPAAGLVHAAHSRRIATDGDQPL